MKKSKILALLLSIVMTTTGLFSMTACSKLTGGKGATKKKVVTIEEGSTWFNADRVVVSNDYQKQYNLDYCYSDVSKIVEEGIISYYSGSYKSDVSYEEMEDWTTEQYAEYYKNLNFGMLQCISYDGDIIWEKDISQTFYTDDVAYCYIQGITEISDELYVSVYSYNSDYSEDSNSLYKIDKATGDVDLTPVEAGGEAEIPDINDSECNYERTIEAGKYKVYAFYGWAESGAYYKLAVQGKDGKLTVINTKDSLTGLEVYDVSDGAMINDSELLLFASTSQNSDFLTLNLDTMKLSVYERPEALNDISAYDMMSLDGKFYVRNTKGISEVDFEAGTLTEIFAFSDCNINLYEINSMSPVIINDDEIILYGTVWSGGYTSSGSSTVIYKITKADSNPNVGKILLTATNLTYLDESVANAIYAFNNNNDEFYISYNEDYTINYNDIDYSASEESYQSQLLSKTAELSNQLAMDMMNGDGPDIILNASSMQELNNSDYLVDLSDYIKDMSNDDYFMNIIEAAKVDDKLYQLPLSFYFEALYGPSGLSESGTGFTFDEYDNIVDKYCNGNDPVNERYGRLSLFQLLVANTSSPIVNSKGKVNLNSDEFRAICEYCASYPELSYNEANSDEFGGSMLYDTYEEANVSYDTGDIKMIYVSSAYNVVETVLADKKASEKTFYGYPSYDGKGPSASIETSVAIAASCANSDGAWQFVEMLTSKDSLSLQYSLTISREAFNDSIAQQIESHNKEVEQYSQWYSQAEMEMYGLSSEPASADDMNLIIDAIEAITTVSGVDSQMLQIVTEEIQPYFAEQKSLEDVLLIMEDKCQTVVDERA